MWLLLTVRKDWPKEKTNRFWFPSKSSEKGLRKKGITVNWKRYEAWHEVFVRKAFHNNGLHFVYHGWLHLCAVRKIHLTDGVIG